jgi:RHS repeat-associated protein
MTKRFYFLKNITIGVLVSITLFAEAQNTALPVGSLPGSIDVSATGAAIYTIPIEVVPGTAGIQPNLSIVYNSQSGRGLLGMKWTLSGLSAVSRVPQTDYYDGKQTGITLSYDDRFALDGNRLILINDQQYGKNRAEYAFENENFARITGIYDGHYAFEMMSAEGILTEYGYPDNAKCVVAKGDNDYAVVSWLVNKVMDKDGNSMYYHYGTSGTERWIDSITYTSGYGLQPYATIKFAYITDPVSANTLFTGGIEGIAQTKLLKTITVYYQNQQVRKYNFDYDLTRTAHLTKITLYGADNSTTLSPTTITWEANERDISTQNVSILNAVASTVITGDFNGDGITDIVYYKDEYESSGIWKLYCGNSYGGYSCTVTGSLLPVGINNYGYRSILRAGDIDGYAGDELIIAERISSTNNFKYKCHYITFQSNGSQRQNYSIQNEMLPLANMMVGDFNGNGKADIMFRYLDNEIYCWGHDLNATMNYFEDPQASFTLVEADNDGKTEILVTDEDGTRMYKINTNSFTGIFKGFPTNDHICYYGDFNGDGITDVLFYITSNQEWAMCLGTGNRDFSWPVYHFPSNTLKTDKIQNGIYPKYNPLIADVDGDGKDDIIQIECNQTTDGLIITTHGSYLNVYYSKGYVNNAYQCESQRFYTTTVKNDLSSHFYFNDFNGDGKMDMLYHDYVANPVIVFFDKNKKYEFVKQITDGFGNSQKITYKPLHATANYWLVTNSYSMQKRILFYVTDKLYCSNGLNNGWNEYGYNYQTPRYCIPRRQFLGFEEFTKKDFQTNRTTKQTASYYTSRELLLPHRTIIDNVSKKAIIYYMQPVSTLIPTKRFFFSKIVERDTNVLNRSIIVSESHFYTDDDILKGRLFRKIVQVVNQDNLQVLTQSKSRYRYNFVMLSPVFNYYQLPIPSLVYDTAYMGTNYMASRKQYTFYPNSTRLQKIQDITPDDIVITHYSNYNDLGIARCIEISASGLTSRLTTNNYDNTGRFVTSSVNSKNQTSSATYDPKTGNILTTTDINGLTTTCRYDAFGRQRAVIYPDNTKDSTSLHWYTASQIPNACYYSKNYSTGLATVTIYYDRLGREVCQQADGSHSDTRYNALGQVVKTSLPYGSSLSVSDANKTWHTYTYDTYGRITGETAPYTNITYAYYSVPERKVETTDNLKNITTTKKYDAAGRLIAAIDPGGTIGYSYAIVIDNNKKRKRTQITTGGQTTTIFTDSRGNRVKIVDPNAGTITSVYNAYGELTKQTDANGNITNYSYDQLGRVIQKKYSGADDSQTIDYSYDTYSSTNRGRGQLSSIKINNVTTDLYTYDALGRSAQTRKTIDGTHYTQSYTYNANGQLDVLTYPNNFAVKHTYDSYGRLQKILRNDNDAVIYRINAWDKKLGNLTEYNYGNNIFTQLSYNSYGLLTQIKRGNKTLHTGEIDGTTVPIGGISVQRSAPIGGISGNTELEGSDILTETSLAETSMYYDVNNAYQELNYTYNNLGLITQRANAKNSQTETFTYDNLNRLTNYRINNGAVKTFTYAANGNIATHPDVGSYAYNNSAHPNGVSSVTLNSNNVESSAACEVTYNWFNKPKTISEHNNLLTFNYGSNNQRTKTVLTQGSSTVKTNYFISSFYEKEVTPAGTRHLNYIYGADGIVAICVQTSATDAGTTYYIHTDHLGSYTLITDQNKNRVDSLWFDAWGNRRQYNNWANADTCTSFLFYRGFTGHEHLDLFKIINMNGRLYDPVIARFFSPDPFVQMPEFTQGYNRYSYCLNNPLMFTDPSGEFLQLAAMALVFVGDAISNLIYGVDQPFQTAINTAITVVNGMANCLQFPIYSNNGFSISVGLNPFALGFAFNFGYSWGNGGIGVSAGYSFMGSWFVGGGLWQNVSDVNISFGAGAGKNYWGWNASMSYNGFGFSYGQTNYGGALGHDKLPNAQRVGSVSLLFPNGSFTLQNDFLGDKHDRWRSSAVELVIGNFIVGTWLYNNDPEGTGQGINLKGLNRFGQENRPRPANEEQVGAWENGKTYASPFYIGYRFGNHVERIGYSSKWVQELTQNLVHRWVPFGRQNFYVDDSNFTKGIYLYTGYYNPYSIWHPRLNVY